MSIRYGPILDSLGFDISINNLHNRVKTVFGDDVKLVSGYYNLNTFVE